MKIFNLKFKNINSLKGEHEIDFTKPEFTNNGIFAITGKTGAGKSSILDAITLALYGRTPRLDITTNENEVMTKGEKDCYAEIIFEVNEKIYKSSWKQERARTGTLKNITRTISDSENKIIAEHVRECDSKIVEIIKLSFDQFTKVIMLAQGSFSAFLEADKNQKGELLEQITGTEIYATISKFVYERSKVEQEKLNKILTELDTIKVLSQEQRENLIKEIEIFENNKKLIDEEIQKLTNAKNWILELQNIENQIKEIKKNLPLLEEQYKNAKGYHEEIEKKLNDAKEEQKKFEPIFKQVRESDIKIAEKNSLLKPILASISELDKQIDLLSNDLKKSESDLENKKKKLSEKQQWMSDNKRYEDLERNYIAIEKEYHLLTETKEEIKKLRSEIDALNKKVKSQKLEVEKATNDYNEKTKILTEKTKELESKKSSLKAILNGKNLSDIQFEKEKLSNFIIQVRNLIDNEATLSSIKKEIDTIEDNLIKFKNLKEKISKEIDRNKELISDFESKIKLLDENIKLTKTIQSLEEHRKQLEDGKPCPLCGALEHPYARRNIPIIGEKEEELSSLKAKFDQIIKTYQQNEKELAALNTNIENYQKKRIEEEEKFKKFLEKQDKIVSDLKNLDPNFTIPTENNKMEKLNEISLHIGEKFSSLKNLIEQATNYEKQIEILRDKEIPKLQNEKDISEKSKNKAETDLKLIDQQLKEKEKTASETQEKYDYQEKQFSNKLQVYEVKTIEGLKKCLDSWIENKQMVEKLSTDITNLEKNVEITKSKLDSTEKQKDGKNKEYHLIETEKEILLQKRKSIFGEESVEEKEKSLKETLKSLENEKQEAERRKNNVFTELEKNKAIILQKEKELERIKSENITDNTLDEIENEISDKKNKLDEYSQKIGANNQSLKDNEEKSKSREMKLKEKEDQETINRKWSMLNSLIGSADGKKYRNFAQALTFEHLIGLSNIHLKKMSDRYILKRVGDSSNPFELSVIDKYQNGEERTIKNLSGGEKFIVSLSLALGLSSMVGKNVKIDTMFIDEGFGTLDSDYLDVALNALSNLQSEGKIIGVISHISELKERIPIHIEVIPVGNGHSKIQITT